MSVNLRIKTRQTGLTVYGFIRRVNDGYIYSTVEGDFVSPVALDVADYILAFTEDAISKKSYVYTNSDDWVIGRYTLEAYSQAGGSPNPALDNIVCPYGKFNIQNRGVYTGYIQAPDSHDDLGNLLNEFVTAPLAERLDTTVGALVESTATDGSTTTLEDTTHSWTVDSLIDAWIIITCAASGISYPRKITSNTADEYTFSLLPESVVVGDEYVILSTIAAYDLVRVGGTTQTGADLTPYVLGSLQSSTTHVADDVTVLADTQGSYVLPSNTKMIQLTMIDGSDADEYITSFTTGNVAPRGTEGDQHYGGHKTCMFGLNITGKTLYFATSKVGGATFHIEVWS
jgi:hypothetical protein